MDRRRFLGRAGLELVGLGLLGTSCLGAAGCRGRQTAEVKQPWEPTAVGSHSAGAETFGPLVYESTSRLLARHSQGIQPVGFAEGQTGTLRICFVGVENKSAEEIGDFKEQIYQQIDTCILQSPIYEPINRRFVEAGLRETRLRPDQLFVPQNMRLFSEMMERQGQPFDYLLYATVSSGTTRDNLDYQRDYLLTLEMIHVASGQYDKESAMIRKQYNRSAVAKIKSFNPFK